MMKRLAVVVLVACLWPSSTYAEGRSLKWGLVALDVALTADLAVTLYGVQSGRVTELNPTWRWAQSRPIVFGIVRGGAQIGLREAVRKSKSATLAWTLAGVGCGVLIWNVGQVRGAR